jgi:hypothetical protein
LELDRRVALELDRRFATGCELLVLLAQRHALDSAGFTTSTSRGRDQHDSRPQGLLVGVVVVRGAVVVVVLGGWTCVVVVVVVVVTGSGGFVVVVVDIVVTEVGVAVESAVESAVEPDEPVEPDVALAVFTRIGCWSAVTTTTRGPLSGVWSGPAAGFASPAVNRAAKTTPANAPMATLPESPICTGPD